MPETLIALLVPPLRDRPLPAAPLPRAVPCDDVGPVIVGVAEVDGSGRVRERAVLAALGWSRGNLLDIRVVRDIAVLYAAPRGRLHVDGRDQIALPAGCRAVLGIRPGDRVVLASIPARAVALVCPMAIAAGWIWTGISDLPGSSMPEPHAPTGERAVPSLAQFQARATAACTPHQRSAYVPVWQRACERLGTTQLDQITTLDLRILQQDAVTHALPRASGRGGRYAGERTVRALYRMAEQDDWIDHRHNPAAALPLPRRKPSTRWALTSRELAEINAVVPVRSRDPALDCLLIRLHVETACRRGGVLALRLADLDTRWCLIRLREKGGTVRWQPISPTLAAALERHTLSRRCPRTRRAAAPPRPPTTQRATLRRPVEPHPHPAALGRRTRRIRTLATPHHHHLGRTPLRLRHRPRLRRPHRHRQRTHRHLHPRPHHRNRPSPERTDRRTPPPHLPRRTAASTACSKPSSSDTVSTAQNAHAIRRLLTELGLTVDDLLRSTEPTPTLAHYLPRVIHASGTGALRTYQPYWERITAALGERRLDEITATDLEALIQQAVHERIRRRTDRGGTSTREHTLRALRAIYNRAVADKLLPPHRNPHPQTTPTTDHPPRPEPRRTRRDQHHRQRHHPRLPPDPTAHRNRSPPQRRPHPARTRPRPPLAPHSLDGETRHRWQPVSRTFTQALLRHREARGTDQPLLRYRNGNPLTTRRYDHLWHRIGQHLPWVTNQGITTHWLRHTTLTWIERRYGYGIARAYGGHLDTTGPATTTYIRATLHEIATALTALTGENHPCARPPVSMWVPGVLVSAACLGLDEFVGGARMSGAGMLPRPPDPPAH